MMDSVKLVGVEQWQQDKLKSDRYINQIKALLGLVIVEEAPWKADAKEATDLIVAEIHPCRVACRIRDYDQYRYREDFTIRSSRTRGTKTELIKILSGWGDFMFYGFSDPKRVDIFAASLLNLAVFREAYAKHQGKINAGKETRIKGRSIPNKDGSSVFIAFELESFPPELIVKQWPPEYHLQETPQGIDWCNIL